MIVWGEKEMTIEEFREKVKDEEYAPGWDAIEEAFAKCYPGQEPNHYGTNIEARAMFGGSEYIDGYSFSNCKSLKSITLGKNIRRLEYSTFSDCTQLQEIHCLPITPPTISEFCFDSEVLNNCKLYIPKGTYNDYWIAQGWGDFKNIIEGDGSIDSALIIGNWKLLTHNGQVATHVTFNNDGTFLYTSVNDGAYSEHGIYKIENNILYEKFSDEDTWCMSEIFTLNSIALTLRDLDEDGITYVGDSYTYQRVE